MQAKELATQVCHALIEKKGTDMQVIKVEDVTTLTEYFVICSATSTTQVKALADHVEWKLKTDFAQMPHHTEGFESAQWILLDYGSVIVHVFMPEARQFYQLEKLWQDGVRIPLADLGITDDTE